MAENYEELIKRLRYEATWQEDYPETQKLMIDAADAIEGLLAYCNNQEDTIKELVDELEKVERKHGKWTLFENDIEQNAYECSVCKDVFVLLEGTPQDNLYNFCPNCGAWLDGK